MTIGARLTRLEMQLTSMERKMDGSVRAIQAIYRLVHHQQQQQQQRERDCAGERSTPSRMLQTHRLSTESSPAGSSS